MTLTDKLQTQFAKNVNEILGIGSNLLALYLKADEQLIAPFTNGVMIDSMNNSMQAALQAEINAGVALLQTKTAALVGPTL